jgi:hypothetical protein
MRRPAYTLIEVTLAMGITTVVLLGAQSAVIIASRAIPSGTSGPSAVAAASGAMSSIADDLAVATTFSALTATTVEFTVPDRDGDALADTIRYSWSGTAGAPLERRFNGGTAVTVAAGVQDLILEYERALVNAPTTYTDSAEGTLFLYSPSSPVNVGVVASNKWWAQYFNPTLPAEARSWSITRAFFNGKRNSGNTGRAKAQIRPDAGGSPGPQVLGEVLLLESTMDSNFAVVTASYSSVGGLTPGEGVWLVFQWVSDTQAFDIQYKSGTGVGADAPLKSSINNGATWLASANCQLPLLVYGTVNGPAAAQTQHLLTGVKCRLRVGPSARDSISQTWRVLNKPVVAGP